MEPEASEQAPQEAVSEGPARPGEGGIHPLPPSAPLEKPRRWRPSNLTLRLMTAAVLVPPLIWVCQYGGLPFVLVIIVLNCLGIHEFYNFIEQKGTMKFSG